LRTIIFQALAKMTYSRVCTTNMHLQRSASRTNSCSISNMRYFPSKFRVPVAIDLRMAQTGVSARFTSASRQHRGTVRLSASAKDQGQAQIFVDPALPKGPEETVQQARAAISAAISDGMKRLEVEFPLPLIGATDLDDWPGGVRQQFKAARPMVDSILGTLPGVPESDGLKTSILDQADAVALWESKAVVAVLFPLAETLDKLKELASSDLERPVMYINKQWSSSGQIISDFGWGPWRAKRESFLAEFSPVFTLTSIRILGEDVRLMYAYPGKWQVYAISMTGEIEKVASLDARPTYKEMEELLKLREGSPASQDAITRLVSEFKFNSDSLKRPEE